MKINFRMKIEWRRKEFERNGIDNIQIDDDRNAVSTK